MRETEKKIVGKGRVGGRTWKEEGEGENEEVMEEEGDGEKEKVGKGEVRRRRRSRREERRKRERVRSGGGGKREKGENPITQTTYFTDLWPLGRENSPCNETCSRWGFLLRSPS